jgi:ribose transport system permease protein
MQGLANLARRALTPEVIRRYGMVMILVLVVAGSQLVYPNFLDPINVRNILSQNAPVGIVAVGMTMVMITQGFDLSVGSVYAGGATLFAGLTVTGWPPSAAAVATIIAGIFAGSCNGVIVTRLKVNPFVATLGTMSAFSGLALIYSQSQPIIVTNEAFTVLGRGFYFGLPISIWILLTFLVGGQVVLSNTVYGRQLYAIGGNDEASRLAGLRTQFLRGSTYVICSVCAVIAGMIIASRLALGQADIGPTMALDSIAVVVIGGTSLLGGEGAIWQTAVGLLIVAALKNILDSLAIDTNYQLLIKGVIVVVAVAIDAKVSSRR